MLKTAYELGVLRAMADAGLVDMEKNAVLVEAGIGALAAPKDYGWEGAVRGVGGGYLGALGGMAAGGLGGAGLGALLAQLSDKYDTEEGARIGGGIGGALGLLLGNLGGAYRAGSLAGQKFFGPGGKGLYNLAGK